MRILVVTDDLEGARTHGDDLRRAGFEVAGHAARQSATAAMRRLRADAVVVVDDGRAPLEVSAIRRLVERLRGAAESRLPVALLLDDDSLWLRARLPADLAPIVAMRLDAAARTVGDALERLGSDAAPLAFEASTTVRLDVVRREVTGPLGASPLTPSELSILWELARTTGAVVTYDVLSRALWGVPADGATRGALRTHLHTLRAKLRRVAGAFEIENRPGVGYRLDAPLAVREPRG